MASAMLDAQPAVDTVSSGTEDDNAEHADSFQFQTPEPDRKRQKHHGLLAYFAKSGGDVADNDKAGADDDEGTTETLGRDTKDDKECAAGDDDLEKDVETATTRDKEETPVVKKNKGRKRKKASKATNPLVSKKGSVAKKGSDESDGHQGARNDKDKKKPHDKASEEKGAPPETLDQPLAAASSAAPASLSAPASLPGKVFPRDLMPRTTPLCTKCGVETDPFRMIGKAPKSFRCPQCNTRMVQLNRMLGCWPPLELKAWSAEEMTAFFVDAKDCTSLTMLDKLVFDKMVRQRINVSRSKTEAKFLPLGCWKKMGWDTNAIMESSTPENEQVCPRFGKLYRVEVKSDEKETVEQSVREWMMKSKKQVTQKPSTDAETIAHPKKCESDDDDSTDSKTHKKKKHTKDKKKVKKIGKKDKPHKKSSKSSDSSSSLDANEKMKRLQAEQRRLLVEKKKEAAATERTAMKVSMKLAPVLPSLQALVSSKDLSTVPAFCADALKKSTAELDKMNKETNIVLKGKGDQKLSFTIDQVKTAFDEAMTNKKLVQEMIASLQKFGKA